MAKQLYEVLEGLLRVQGGTGGLAKGELALWTYCAPPDRSCWPGGSLKQCAGKFMYLQYPSGIDIFHWVPVLLLLYLYSGFTVLPICILFFTPCTLRVACFYNIEICCVILVVPGIKNSWNRIVGGCGFFLLFFQFKGLYLYVTGLGKLIAKLPWIKISRSTKVSLGITSDSWYARIHHSCENCSEGFPPLPEILSSSPFSALDLANIPFAVKQAKATKTCSKGLHIQTWVKWTCFCPFP